MKIILGSQSRGRQKVLREAGFDFEVMPADIDEKAIRTDDYELLPQLIAKAKNDALVEKIHEPAILITADTVTIFEGELREKPVSEAQAREFLRSYEPRTPSIIVSAVAVTNLTTGKKASGYSRAEIYFKRFDHKAIEHIITDGYVMGCAGAFAIELPLFQNYIDRISGDADSVIGVSAQLVTQLIGEVTA
ncbi:MAG TPA: Maf family protein [Candidatus Microsaccharimonas sp.]|nr:Maf family protein [Candidatus Microsaccharimonas sp.]